MSRCPGPHLLSCGVCGGTDAGLLARAEAAERERDRLRGALEEAEGRLRDYAWEIGGHSGDSESGEHFDDCELCAVEVTIAKVEAALAGEGEACASAKERLPGECCRCYQTSDLPSCSDGREHCQHHSGGEAAEAQPTCTRCRMEPAYETLRICLGCSHVPGVVAPVDDDTLTATHLAAVQEERERCARIAETYPLAPDTHTGTRQRAMREGIAEAIRGGEEAPCHYCDYEDQEPCFSAFFGYFYCTRPKGHDGVHVACSESKHAVAMVSVDTIPEKAGEP